MLSRLARGLVHVIGFALVCAMAAYWIVKIITPAPTAAPAPLASPPPRDVDAVLAARMFGLIQLATQAPVASNVQVAGIFSAGRDSSAVLIVDNKPARAYVIGQEVAPGLRLVAVRANGVTIENTGGKQDVGLAGQPNIAPMGAPGQPSRAFELERGVLSAPSAEAAATRAPTPPAGNQPAPPSAAFPNNRPPPGPPGTVTVPPPTAVPGPAPPPMTMSPPASTPGPNTQ